MCLMNRQPVIYAPCSGCSEFLTSCMPLIVEGLIFGECDDFSYIFQNLRPVKKSRFQTDIRRASTGFYAI